MEQFTTQWSPFALLDGLLPTPNYRRFQRGARRLDEIVFRIIRERRAAGAEGHGSDLLGMLLAAHDADGSRMSDQQLRDEAVTFFFAGHETTALALSWTWYLLAQHPEVEARLLQELDSVLGGRLPTAADIPCLVYAERVLKEALRLYPPVWSVARQAREALELGGHPIPAGAELILSAWVTQRDPRIFPEAGTFLPDRWEREPASPGAYFPFGAGPRACIGERFAMMELLLVLATIAPRYRLRLLTGYPVEPWVTMTLRPRDGIRVRVEAR
jgi:cytochrome P450